MSAATICERCYQNEVCEMAGSSVTTLVLLGYNPLYSPEHPEECFFHCCVSGIEAGLQALRQARIEGTTGLVPFSTEDHKPYIEGVGRYVNNDPLFGETRDVFVFTDNEGPGYKVTNLMKLRPPKR